MATRSGRAALAVLLFLVGGLAGFGAGFGYVLALPWQLVVSVVYAGHTFGTWGYAPLP